VFCRSGGLSAGKKSYSAVSADSVREKYLCYLSPATLELAEDSEERLFLVFSLACSLTPEKKEILSVNSVGSVRDKCISLNLKENGGGPWSRTRNTGLQSVPLPLG
jgi:hypothetical protein